MRRRAFCLWVLVATAWAVLSEPAGASLIAYDGFAPSFPVYASGGMGFVGPWTTGGFNALASDYTIGSPSLRTRRLRTNGGAIAGAAQPIIHGMLRTLEQPLGQDGTTVYVSFVVRPRGPLNAGVFNGFFGVTLNGDLGNDFFAGKSGGGAVEDYVLETRGGAGQVSSGTSVVVGRTALLVVRVDFLAGNDTITLYVNPSLPGAEPSAGAVKTDLDLGAVSRVGIYSTGAFSLDEIRIGTTYADVVPAP